MPTSNTTKAELTRRLAELGYKIDESSSFNYVNNLNPHLGPSFPARSCYVVESDTGLSFANINARRDENFKRLQEMRATEEFLIAGRVYEI